MKKRLLRLVSAVLVVLFLFNSLVIATDTEEIDTSSEMYTAYVIAIAMGEISADTTFAEFKALFEEVVEPEPGDTPSTPGTDPVPPPSGEIADDDHGDGLVRVGLYYGSKALTGANLANAKGAGFRFGYYDNSNSFHELARYSGKETISIAKTTNVYYATVNDYTTYYEDQNSASVWVGCYHLQLPKSYTNFTDARAAADQQTGGFVAYINGKYYVRFGSYLSQEAASVALAGLGLAAEVVGTSEYGLNVILTGTNKILFQYDDNGSGTGLGVKPIPSREGEKCVTYFYKGKTWYGGFRYERIGGKNMTVVNMVELDDYIKGILPYEMNNTWPMEALKAQAVCARNYVVTIPSYRHSAHHFDICTTTDCQVYNGTKDANARTDQAVDETAGQLALYNGKPIQAFYCSSDGGATENVENVWMATLPYLRGVEDPYEALVADKIPGYHWTKTFTAKQLQEMFNKEGFPCGEIVDLRVSKLSDTGNVCSITFTDNTGTSWTISKENNVKILFGAKSIRYSISKGGNLQDYATTNGGTLDSLNNVWIMDGNGNLVKMSTDTAYAVTAGGVEAVDSSAGWDGTFILKGTGTGHCLGMSQWGAYSMAKEGFTYKEILKFYFTGIEIGEER